MWLVRRVNVHVMVYVYEMVHVYLFMYVLFLYVRYATLLEADCAVGDSNTFEDDPARRFWARQVDSPSAYSVCTYSLHIIMFILIYCIIWWDSLIKDFLDLLPVFLV